MGSGHEGKRVFYALAPRPPGRMMLWEAYADNVYPLGISGGALLAQKGLPAMARPKSKTSATTLKMTPEVRDLWERCAAEEHRTLTNMFEVMVRAYAKNLRVEPAVVPAPPKRAAR